MDLRLSSAEVLKLLQRRTEAAIGALDLALFAGDIRVAMYVIDRIAPPEKLMHLEAARVLEEQRALIERKDERIVQLEEQLERLTKKSVVRT